MNCFENAISEYWLTKNEVAFSVKSNLGDEVTYHASYFYRPKSEMPLLEQTALAKAKGKILDIGAGVGCHALILQEEGFDVDAIEQSEVFCSIMKERGVENVICKSVWSYNPQQQYNTIYLLMNGIGIAENIDSLTNFVSLLKTFLAPDGVIYLDSADIDYLYDELPSKQEIPYYGEIEYQVSYQNNFDQPFEWLFIDFETLKETASSLGLHASKVKEGNANDYLAKLSLMR